MPAYYSEFDPKAAAWLRELIKRGLIADGVVDERDLWDVAPADLRDFTQVHLCAGIGVWSYSLRSAGWSDDRPVWTGSFPCQPFSAAGKGEGFADERHLWPAGCHLIAECRPAVVFGEQVASKDADPWLDLVQADLEALDYAVGAVPFPSAGVGAPHIRDRLYWVADASGARAGRDAGATSGAQTSVRGARHPDGRDCGDALVVGGAVRGLAYADRGQRDGLAELRGPECDGQDAGRPEGGGEFGPRRYDGGLADADDARPQGRIERGDGAEQRPARAGGVAGGLADSDSSGSRTRQRNGTPSRYGHSAPATSSAGFMASSASDRRGEERAHDSRQSGRDSAQGLAAGPVTGGSNAGLRRTERSVPDGSGAQGEHGLREVALRPGPVNSQWRDADWLYSRDGFWRPVEPDTQPLVDGSSQRVGRLRGYGNAINAEAAKVFIEAYLDTCVI